MGAEIPRSDTLVLVLGAGASFGARTTAPPPPLGNGLARYLTQWLQDNASGRKSLTCCPYHDVYLPTHCPFYAGESLWEDADLAEVQSALERAAEREHGEFMTAFEDLMNQWARRSEDERKLRLTQKILAYSMLVGRSCAFYEQPDLYDELLKCLDYDRIVVVTLNYDLLVEEAVLRSGGRFTYPGLSGTGETDFTSTGGGNAIGIYKLHGSVNWTAPAGAVGGTDLASLTAQADARLTRLLPSPTGGFSRQSFATCVSSNRHCVFFELEMPSRSYGPVVGIFGTGKPVLENPTHLDQHRRACERALGNLGAADVLAIGIRIPPEIDDDPILGGILALVAKIDGTKTYVSPSEADCERFEKSGFKICVLGLKDWLVGEPVSTKG